MIGNEKEKWTRKKKMCIKTKISQLHIKIEPGYNGNLSIAVTSGSVWWQLKMVALHHKY